MSRDILGNKQTIILRNCLIRNEKYDLVITPHAQKTDIADRKGKKKKDKDSNTETNY